MVDLNSLLIQLIIAVVIIVGAALTLNWLLRLRLVGPTQQQVIDALLPYIYRGIWAAEKVAQNVLKEFQIELQGADKKAIADRLYDLIPEVVLVGRFPVPIGVIKKLVNRDQFRELVQEKYGEVSAFFKRNTDYLRDTVDNLIPDEFERTLQLENAAVSGHGGRNG